MNKLYTHFRHRSRGFTVVELVIVIIVIAILAIIILTTYNGAQTRTNNSRTLTGIQQYYTSIKLYYAKNGGKYPPVPNEGTAQVTMTCLGTGYPGGTCGTITGTTVNESTSFMSTLRQGSGTNITGVVNDQAGSVGSESFIGAAYGIDTTTSAHSPTGRARMIEWFLAGKNQDCKIPQAWAYNTAHNNTACELDLEPY